MRVWRLTKHVSQLLVITFAFWGGVTGQLDTTVAFGGMLVTLVGAEFAETLLVGLGEGGVDVSISASDSDGGEDERHPDGGAVIADTPDTDPRQERERRED